MCEEVEVEGGQQVCVKIDGTCVDGVGVLMARVHAHVGVLMALRRAAGVWLLGCPCSCPCGVLGYARACPQVVSRANRVRLAQRVRGVGGYDRCAEIVLGGN